ncbi:hypothetical protein TNCV_926671 [Trichonephila clavipes]|nr:hypothetical protein TNCV_926671 [Trichonephila clavipes]
MISSSRDSTGLAIETSSLTPHFHEFEFLCCCHVPQWHASAANNLSTYVGFKFIGSRTFPAGCIEYVHALRSSSRS